MPPIPTQMDIQKLVAESGQSALKAMLLLNGGAAIAFLAFAGAVLKDSGGGSEQAAAFGFVMRCFLVRDHNVYVPIVVKIGGRSSDS